MSSSNPSGKSQLDKPSESDDNCEDVKEFLKWKRHIRSMKKLFKDLNVREDFIEALPHELIITLGWDHCGVCGVTFNEDDESTEHYSSLTHYWKLSQKIQDDHARQAMPIPEEIIINCAPLRPRNEICELCDKQFATDDQAETHYIGKLHETIVFGEKAIKNPSLLIVPEGIQRTIQLLQREKALMRKAASSRGKGDLYCDVCDCTLNSVKSFQDHFDGRKHWKQFVKKSEEARNKNGKPTKSDTSISKDSPSTSKTIPTTKQNFRTIQTTISTASSSTLSVQSASAVIMTLESTSPLAVTVQSNPSSSTKTVQSTPGLTMALPPMPSSSTLPSSMPVQPDSSILERITTSSIPSLQTDPSTSINPVLLTISPSLEPSRLSPIYITNTIHNFINSNIFRSNPLDSQSRLSHSTDDSLPVESSFLRIIQPASIFSVPNYIITFLLGTVRSVSNVFRSNPSYNRTGNNLNILQTGSFLLSNSNTVSLPSSSSNDSSRSPGIRESIRDKYYSKVEKSRSSSKFKSRKISRIVPSRTTDTPTETLQCCRHHAETLQKLDLIMNFLQNFQDETNRQLAAINLNISNSTRST